MTLATHDERAAEWADAAPFERFILTQLLAEQQAYRRWSKEWRRSSKAVRAQREAMCRWYGPQSIRALDDDDVRLLQRFHRVDLFAGVRGEPTAAGAAEGIEPEWLRRPGRTRPSGLDA